MKLNITRKKYNSQYKTLLLDYSVTVDGGYRLNDIASFYIWFNDVVEGEHIYYIK